MTAAAAAALWFASAPDPLTAVAIPAHRADPANGRVLFDAGSCGTCHRAADDGPEDAICRRAAHPSRTPVGSFYPGNLTPDRETGLGAWTETEFVNAMVRGLAPDGRHYFPSFPYTSFRRMRMEDVLDLRAYLMSLPAVRSPGRPATLPLLPLARRGVGPVEARRRTRPRACPRRRLAQRLLEPRSLPVEQRRPLRRVPHAAQRADGARSRSASSRAGRTLAARDRFRAYADSSHASATRTRRTWPSPCSSARPTATTSSRAAAWARSRRTWRGSRRATCRRSPSTSSASLLDTAHRACAASQRAPSRSDWVTRRGARSRSTSPASTRRPASTRASAR